MGRLRAYVVDGQMYVVDCGSEAAAEDFADRLLRLGLVTEADDRGPAEPITGPALEFLLRERDGRLCRHTDAHGQGWCDQKAAPGETRCERHLAVAVAR